MISKETKKYIQRIANKKRISIPDNYTEALSEYCLLVEKRGHKLEFRTGRNLAPDSLGANAGLFGRSSIVVTPEWAAKLVFENADDTRNAFLITLGHELTHKDKEIFPLRFGFRWMSLIAYINEIHADYSAAQKMVESKRSILLKSVDYKRYHKVEIRGIQDKDTPEHPSWTRRKSYIESFNFDAQLIRKIALDLNCQNIKIIKYLIEFYDEIVLY